MKTYLTMASPLILLLAGVLLFFLQANPASRENDGIVLGIAGDVSRFERTVLENSFPSRATLESLQMKRDMLEKSIREYGALTPDPANETSGTVLKEWGYASDAAVGKKLEAVQTSLDAIFGAEHSEGVRKFVNHTARNIGLSELSNCLDMLVSPALNLPDSPGHGRLPVFFIRFSFFSGITEAVEFVENWILTAPSGVVIRPVKTVFQRQGPDHWGDELDLYSGPPIRVDLDLSVTLVNA